MALLVTCAKRIFRAARTPGRSVGWLKGSVAVLGREELL